VDSEGDETQDLNYKMEKVFKAIEKEKEMQLLKIDVKFKELLATIKEKYKSIKTEITQMYEKTEEDVKVTFKGLTSLVNIIGRTTRQVLNHVNVNPQ
jgi:predicted transport protein